MEPDDLEVRTLRERGLALRKAMFGEEAVEGRMRAAGEFGAPLQNIINAYIYGDIWSREGLSPDIRSLVMLGITAASNRPEEFRVHVKGAIAAGCSAEQIQGVLLLVAMYCGVPAAIQTHTIAAELLAAAKTGP